MNHQSNIVLIVGSAPDATLSRDWNKRIFNLSSLDESRLVFPRASIDEVHAIGIYGFGESLASNSLRFDNTLVNNAIRRELELGYHFESGRYWDYLNQICPQECHALDQLWLNGLNEVDQTHPNLLSQSQS